MPRIPREPTGSGQRAGDDALLCAAPDTLLRLLVGPFHDVRRFLTGVARERPATRQLGRAELDAARGVLAEAGCDLSLCTETNLHADVIPLPAAQVYEVFATWEAWPISSFFICPWQAAPNGQGVAYRFSKTFAVVVMQLKAAVSPRYIIYDLVWGIGAGGYHGFLFRPISDDSTEAAIISTFPRTRLFLEGLHDQMNLDIYRRAHALAGGPAAR